MWVILLCCSCVMLKPLLLNFKTSTPNAFNSEYRALDGACTENCGALLKNNQAVSTTNYYKGEQGGKKLHTDNNSNFTHVVSVTYVDNPS